MLPGYLNSTELSSLSSEKLHYLTHLLAERNFPYILHHYLQFHLSVILDFQDYDLCVYCCFLIYICLLYAFLLLTFYFCCMSYFLHLIDGLCVWNLWHISWVLPLVHMDCPPHMSIFFLWCAFILEHLFSIVPTYFLCSLV